MINTKIYYTMKSTAHSVLWINIKIPTKTVQINKKIKEATEKE